MKEATIDLSSGAQSLSHGNKQFADWLLRVERHSRNAGGWAGALCDMLRYLDLLLNLKRSET